MRDRRNATDERRYGSFFRNFENNDMLEEDYNVKDETKVLEWLKAITTTTDARDVRNTIPTQNKAGL